LRLLLDEQHDPRIAKLLRNDGLDVITVAEHRDLREMADADVLATAIAERRCVVTEDVRDFAILHRRLLGAGRTHYGIVLTSPRRCPRRRKTDRQLLAALRSILRAYSSDDALRDQLIWLARAS
jgi:predicted nuclease of predicted toxin-antitoxin system